ncbi:MAG: translation initiation factor IF-2 [Alphaproteobacteria bacterium]|nr:translation initiation factor IF-2 [Alphaproteobacteria bacterium]
MTENQEKKSKKTLGLPQTGKLELKKNVETAQVRQSFSHGRSKAVAVEVKRKRVRTDAKSQAESSTASPQKNQPVQDVSLNIDELSSTLTAGERAKRLKVLEKAKREEDHKKEVILTDETKETIPNKSFSQNIIFGEKEVEPVGLEEKNKPIDSEALFDKNKTPNKNIVENLVKKTKGKIIEDDEDDEDSERDKSKLALKRTGAGAKLGLKLDSTKRMEPRRRSSKLTIVQALGDTSEERTRSLASVRRAREKEKMKLQSKDHVETAKVIREVIIPETITVQDLANRMAERGVEVIKSLMKMGIMATINQVIDADTAELIAVEFGHKVKRISGSDIEADLVFVEEDQSKLQPRPPVVTVMGHVDHGKTSLLDALRQTDVVASEAGGITQHIGAYQITIPSGQKITFIDTPGHEAFSEMRARGANVTDIVILVVAADDGIKEQTVEAIHHAKAAKVPIIVAINKIDKPGADPMRVRQELLQHELVVEELGGDILTVEVSAKKRLGLEKLEEAILLQAEILELRANPDRVASGIVVEAKLERGRGAVATLLVQQGTIKVGQAIVAGQEWGRVRTLIGNRGKSVDEAGPSAPVEISGLQGAPMAGNNFIVVENETKAREIAEYRQRKEREKQMALSARGSLDQIFSQIAVGRAKELVLVIKTDVQGSLEAIVGSLNKLSTEEVTTKVLYSAVGGINESDVTLARASQAMIIGFNVRANPQARDLARRENIDIRYYSIIYDVVNDIKNMLSGLLSPIAKERFLGYAEIRNVFSISKVGKIAGCFVTEGVVKRGAKVRLLRDHVVIHEGSLKTLKRFKDEVREVKEGYECGMAFENYQDIAVGDVIECFDIEEIARVLN